MRLGLEEAVPDRQHRNKGCLAWMRMLSKESDAQMNEIIPKHGSLDMPKDLISE